MSKRLFIVIAVATCACAYKASSTSDVDGPKLGDAPPPLVLSQTVQGPAPTEISWDKLKGKVVVLEFWATWCGPCIASIPHLNSLVDQFQGKPVVFLSVSAEAEGVVRIFLKSHPIKSWVGLDDYETLTKAFHVQGIPHVLVINAEGRIVGITHPAQLEARHLEEALKGERCSLPEPVIDTRSLLSQTVSTLPPPLFEISIRERIVPKNIQGAICSWERETNGTGFQGRLATVESGLQCVFGFTPSRMKVEGKLPEGYYDFILKAPPGHESDLEGQFIAALRTTFGVEVKKTVREMEVYQLTLLHTNAPGLRPTEKEGGGGQTPGGFRLHGTDMKGVVNYLESALDEPVLDETRLNGLFDADMQWETPDARSKYHPKPAAVIEAARTRMGLQLIPVRRSLEILEVRGIGVVAGQ